MSSTYGDRIKLSIFGQSHGEAIGMTLDGVPAGLHIDFDKLQNFLNRRAPGQNSFSTARKESDKPEFLSGIVDGYTCGAPVTAIIRNQNSRSSDYNNLRNCPRPGHADYTAQVKYGGYQDAAGGGHFSGRLTAPLCIAGAICMQWLEQKGVRIGAHISSISTIYDAPNNLSWTSPDLDMICADFPVLNPEAGKEMQKAIELAKSDGDSLGGIIECVIAGLPAGVGEPMFDGMESKIAQIVYGVPAVKAVAFGNGFQCSLLRGSQNNDAFKVSDGQIRTETNNAGGILGGITNGMPIIFQAAIKPTPSIARPQKSVCLATMEGCSLEIKGRHDPCIVPRAVPVIEAAAAVAVMDAYLLHCE